MKLASCPGQGLCLSHARLDPRHFIALTLPPTVTAALNEATRMCSLQVGQEPDAQLNAVGWASLTLARRCVGALCGFANVCSELLSPQRSEGPHSVSSRDNGVPSVTTVRITEHNRGCAAVMPAQGKQQEAVVVDSAVMKLALRQTDLASVATSAYLLMLNTRQEKAVFNCVWLTPTEVRLNF